MQAIHSSSRNKQHDGMMTKGLLNRPIIGGVEQKLASSVTPWKKFGAPAWVLGGGEVLDIAPSHPSGLVMEHPAQKAICCFAEAQGS